MKQDQHYGSDVGADFGLGNSPRPEVGADRPIDTAPTDTGNDGAADGGTETLGETSSPPDAAADAPVETQAPDAAVDAADVPSSG